jgi:hypothetical protein
MVFSAIAIGCGALLVLFAVSETFVAFQSPSFLIGLSQSEPLQRTHPTLFRMALMLACCCGLSLIGWGIQAIL